MWALAEEELGRLDERVQVGVLVVGGATSQARHLDSRVQFTARTRCSPAERSDESNGKVMCLPSLWGGVPLPLVTDTAAEGGGAGGESEGTRGMEWVHFGRDGSDLARVAYQWSGEGAVLELAEAEVGEVSCTTRLHSSVSFPVALHPIPPVLFRYHPSLGH